MDRHHLDTLGISVGCTQRLARQIKLPLVPMCMIVQSKIRVRHRLASKTHVLYMCVHPSNKHRWPGVALGRSVVVTSTGPALTGHCATREGVSMWTRVTWTQWFRLRQALQRRQTGRRRASAEGSGGRRLGAGACGDEWVPAEPGHRTVRLSLPRGPREACRVSRRAPTWW